MNLGSVFGILSLNHMDEGVSRGVLLKTSREGQPVKSCFYAVLDISTKRPKCGVFRRWIMGQQFKP